MKPVATGAAVVPTDPPDAESLNADRAVKAEPEAGGGSKPDEPSEVREEQTTAGATVTRAKKAMPAKTARAPRATAVKAARAGKNPRAKKAVPGPAVPDQTQVENAAADESPQDAPPAAVEIRSSSAVKPTPPAEPPPPPPVGRQVAHVTRTDTVLSGEILPNGLAFGTHLAGPGLKDLGVPGLKDLTSRPEQIPELLALAAVAHYGAQARANAAWLRETYPNAAAEGIARVATHRFTRHSRNRGIVTGLIGPVAVLVDVGTLDVLHAELILNIAAAFGFDPRSPERAAELLMIQGVYDSVEEARTALAEIARPAEERTGGLGRLNRPFARAVRASVLRLGARRLLSLVPGVGAVIGAITNTNATQDVATRALRFYRTRAST